MESPLLASSDTAVPSLFSEPLIEEESEFSRLIALSNPLAALAEELDYDAGTNSWGNNQHNAHFQHDQRPISYRRRTITTILSGFFCLVHVGCVWGAYTTTAWSETHLRVTLAWQQAFLPTFDGLTDKVVQTNSLATVLEVLGGSGHYVYLASLWVTALLVPCAYMILSPTFVASDHNRVVNWERRMRKFNGRRIIELSMRMALLPVFTWMLVDLAVSPLLQLEWTDTVIQVQNRALGPLGAFSIGIASAILVAVSLRWPPAPSDKTRTPPSPSRRFTPASPPPEPEVVNQPDISRSDNDPPMMVLEEFSELMAPETTTNTPSASAATSRSIVSTNPSVPDLISEAGSNAIAMSHSGMSFAKRVLIFQLGVLSLILWLPSMYLPVIRVAYSGAAFDFLRTSHLQAFLWDIPFTLAKQGASSGASPWVMCFLGMVHLNSLIVAPLLASCLCVLVWLGDPFWAIPSKRFLFALQPCMGGIVFVLALHGTLHALYPTLSFHEHACKLIQLPSEPCLLPQGRPLPGAWFYSLHAIVMEVYVVLTLKWG